MRMLLGLHVHPMSELTTDKSKPFSRILNVKSTNACGTTFGHWFESSLLVITVAQWLEQIRVSLKNLLLAV